MFVRSQQIMAIFGAFVTNFPQIIADISKKQIQIFKTLNVWENNSRDLKKLFEKNSSFLA